MGIYSRDYIRESNGSSRFDFSAGICRKIIIATVVVFVLQLITQTDVRLPDGEIFRLPDGRTIRTSYVAEWFSLNLSSLATGQVWRLLTYAFCHDPLDLLHIAFNMLALWWFGVVVESTIGSREFLWFYLTAAVVAGITYIGLDAALRIPGGGVMGASGATMAVLMLYAMYFPRDKIRLFGIFPVEARWLVAAYVGFDLFPVLRAFSGGYANDGVAHAAHLGGLAFGFLYKTFNWRLSSMLPSFRLPRLGRVVGPRRKIRIYKPAAPESNDDLDAKLDAVLEKIHREGEASLTEREREILKTASQRYKDR